MNLTLRSVFFNVISILTGTGYVNAEFDTWGGFTLILFLGLMFIGGCAGSTTCGVKIFQNSNIIFIYNKSIKKNNLSKRCFCFKI